MTDIVIYKKFFQKIFESVHKIGVPVAFIWEGIPKS